MDKTFKESQIGCILLNKEFKTVYQFYLEIFQLKAIFILFPFPINKN